MLQYYQTDQSIYMSHGIFYSVTVEWFSLITLIYAWVRYIHLEKAWYGMVHGKVPCPCGDRGNSPSMMSVSQGRTA